MQVVLVRTRRSILDLAWKCPNFTIFGSHSKNVDEKLKIYRSASETRKKTETNKDKVNRSQGPAIKSTEVDSL